MTNLPVQRKWLILAIVDIGVASVSTPLSFYVALLFSQQAYLHFALFMGLLTIFNALTYSLGWWISWKIYSKGW